MISKVIEKAFNDQLAAETYSAYLYWSMSAALEEMQLPGFAHWMRAQAQEEMNHAVKFYHHIVERGGRVKLGAIAAPPAEWESPAKMFEEVLKHERHVTALIHKLVETAAQEKDYAAGVFLQWFVNEQVEEEAAAELILSKIKMIQDSKGGLYMLDKEMGQRGAGD
ncbi:MAG TPA: ferritin [Anaerohalosphaeraceae bacterium]|nr:ferritin [Anaerohalosphaeraceae bacterium]HOL89162.1 ferritin [Anaerohalosphaeraceae bacterium]HPP56353.1 ferritin [Anaerohalosphaeraceae bacterium]